MEELAAKVMAIDIFKYSYIYIIKYSYIYLYILPPDLLKYINSFCPCVHATFMDSNIRVLYVTV